MGNHYCYHYHNYLAYIQSNWDSMNLPEAVGTRKSINPPSYSQSLRAHLEGSVLRIDSLNLHFWTSTPRPRRGPRIITSGMGSLQLSDHVVQNRQTSEQMTHWDMLNKTTKFEFSLFNMAQCFICSPVWRFCTTWSLSCKRPIGRQLNDWPQKHIKHLIFNIAIILFFI